ncbi:hypothetical protein Ciccas_010935 [Cichlidogyrus casuarinus]|uniref:Uncharacterized protein n=1 Tax=Cichlidogyrus casuarinus TaxID=1844966 RepID=A0ABD2PSP6_9PLAT
MHVASAAVAVVSWRAFLTLITNACSHFSPEKIRHHVTQLYSYVHGHEIPPGSSFDRSISVKLQVLVNEAQFKVDHGTPVSLLIITDLDMVRCLEIVCLMYLP